MATTNVRISPESQARARALTLSATLCAASMIAQQVAGKATRDTLFLMNFEVASLPYMLIGAAVVSLAAVFIASHGLALHTPARFVPIAFAASAALQLGEWWLLPRAPRPAAVLVYLHIAVLGSVLISAFWSLVNELFDPRTAKRRMGQIAAGGALGGVLGGVLAERIAATQPVATMLPVLAGAHLACAVAASALAKAARAGEDASARRHAHAAGGGAGAAAPSGMRILARDPYLRSLALLVMLGTIAAAILDYTLKARADAAFADDESLLRFFALFYMATSILTFVVQAGLARVALERLGLARTVAAHAIAVAATGIGAIVQPALASAAIARGAEGVLRSSLFRSGYELLFTPIRPTEKRATKAIIDVGAERLGDAAGGGVITLALLLIPQAATPVLLGTAVALAVASLAVARRLHAGYIRSLERNLIDGAAGVGTEADLAYDSGTQTIVLKRPGAPGAADPRASTTISIPAASLALTPGWESEQTIFISREEFERPARAAAADTPVDRDAATVTVERAGQPARAEDADPAVARIVELRSGDARRVRRALGGAAPLSRAEAPWVVDLLAWDDLAPEAIAALRRALPRITGLLVDALLDPDEEFAVRRRIPRVLAASDAPAAALGLLRGLDDKRFEVRYQCGRALARIRERSAATPLRAEEIFTAALREVRVDRSVWESHRLLDRIEEKDDAPFVDEFVRERAGRSMEHLFTILSLALPAQPLQTAYRALMGDDARLRGTALEYLESVLPAEIRESLWPFLDDTRRRNEDARPREEILDELLRSNQSMQINIAELRRQREKP